VLGGEPLEPQGERIRPHAGGIPLRRAQLRAGGDHLGVRVGSEPKGLVERQGFGGGEAGETGEENEHGDRTNDRLAH
jgi:hypothetical protein